MNSRKINIRKLRKLFRRPVRITPTHTRHVSRIVKRPFKNGKRIFFATVQKLIAAFSNVYRLVCASFYNSKTCNLTAQNVEGWKLSAEGSALSATVHPPNPPFSYICRRRRPENLHSSSTLSKITKWMRVHTVNIPTHPPTPVQFRIIVVVCETPTPTLQGGGFYNYVCFDRKMCALRVKVANWGFGCCPIPDKTKKKK